MSEKNGHLNTNPREDNIDKDVSSDQENSQGLEEKLISSKNENLEEGTAKVTDNEESISQSIDTKIKQDSTENKPLNKKQTLSSDKSSEPLFSEPLSQSEYPMKSPSKMPLYLSVISLFVAGLSLGGGYYWSEQRTSQVTDALNAQFLQKEAQLKEQIVTLQKAFDAQNKNKTNELTKIDDLATQLNVSLTEFTQKQNETLTRFNLEQETAQSRFMALEEKVGRLATQDNSTWLIAQADFYLKMAARRLWAEKDVLTAMTLLKTADHSLAQMNDSSLVPIRQAIANDISVLAAIETPDVDGIVSRLTSLSRSIDDLVLKPELRWVSPNREAKNEVSHSLTDWRENFSANLRQFSKDFIQINRVDAEGRAILAPEQVIYLRENLRARLFLASQAVSRQNDSVYQETLNDSINAIVEFFDENELITKHMLSELDWLKQQRLTQKLPESFESRPLLERLVNERVYKWVNESKTSELNAPLNSNAPSESGLTQEAINTQSYNERPSRSGHHTQFSIIDEVYEETTAQNELDNDMTLTQ